MRVRTFAILASSVGLLACGAGKPTKELKTARDTYNRARVSQAAQYSPQSVLEAKQALDLAEGIHDEEPGSVLERSYAYVATRRAEEAIVEGDAARARRDKEMADQRYLTLQEELRIRSGAQREQTAAALGATAAELEREREARRAAEMRAQQALDNLSRVASVREEQRGTVITLSGQVLFLTGKADLLPAAREKLAEVAHVLVQSGDDRPITVEGHTDSRGAEQMNMDLSERRAESVKAYLVSQGVPESRITTVGKGEGSPVASNDDPAGRAINRRVEIVMAPRTPERNPEGMPGTQPGTEQPGMQQQPGTEEPEMQEGPGMEPGMEETRPPEEP